MKLATLEPRGVTAGGNFVGVDDFAAWRATAAPDIVVLKGMHFVEPTQISQLREELGFHHQVTMSTGHVPLVEHGLVILMRESVKATRQEDFRLPSRRIAMCLQIAHSGGPFMLFAVDCVRDPSRLRERDKSAIEQAMRGIRAVALGGFGELTCDIEPGDRLKIKRTYNRELREANKAFTAYQPIVAEIDPPAST